MFRLDAIVNLFDRERPQNLKGICDRHLELCEFTFGLVSEPNLLELNVISDTSDCDLSPARDVDSSYQLIG